MSSLEEFGYREELRRSLTTRDLLVYGMIFMVPIAPYGVFGFVWHDAKGMVPLAYLVGLAGMFSTAVSYATMSREFPVAGSVYSYARHGLHEIAGFFAGWLILLDYILVPALLYLMSAAALQPILPQVPAAAWLGGFIAFNALVNVRGVHLTARVNRVVLWIELASLAAFVGVGLWALYGTRVGGGLTWRPIYDPAVFSPSLVAGATSIAVLSFLGFDGISTLAEEHRGAADAVGRATLLALTLIGALFVAQTWIASDLARGMHFGSLATAFYDVADRAGGRWLRLATILVSVLATGVANAMAAQAAVSRILFAMARDGRLPRVLARVHPTFRTPYFSTGVVAAVSLAVGLLFGGRIDDLSRVVNFGALCGFVLLHLSVINHCLRRQRSRRWGRHLVLPLLGLAVIGYVLAEMSASAKWLGAAWIAIGAVYYVVLAGRLRRPVALDL